MLSYMYTGIHVMYPLFLSYFNETWVCWTDFQKFSNVKFLENPYSGRRVFPYRRIDMTILIFAFRSVAIRVYEL